MGCDERCGTFCGRERQEETIEMPEEIKMSHPIPTEVDWYNLFKAIGKQLKRIADEVEKHEEK